jgi:hypothetical protein
MDISQDPSDVEMDMWSGPKRRRSLQFRDVSPSKRQKPKKQEQGNITPYTFLTFFWTWLKAMNYRHLTRECNKRRLWTLTTNEV